VFWWLGEEGKDEFGGVLGRRGIAGLLRAMLRLLKISNPIS